MKKYICDICGYSFLVDTSADTLPCPICKGKCITEQAMKEHEEMARQIEENNIDDDLTPEQDAIDETKDLIIIKAMQTNIKTLGNKQTYLAIERIEKAEQRARYRKYFLMVGGHIPQGKPITI